jgi:hypothetical protein
VRVKSIGWRTDLKLRELEGAEVVSSADHLVVRTPGNPDFRWGNFMLVKTAPRPGDADPWIREFNATFADAGYAQSASTVPGDKQEPLTMIAADAENHAINIYRSLGFSDHEQHIQLERLNA